MRDPRYKVMAALTAAGLHQTDYGRHVIATAPTWRPTRPDNLTTAQKADRLVSEAIALRIL